MSDYTWADIKRAEGDDSAPSVEMQQAFLGTLRLAANDPEGLRASDVDRVMADAYARGFLVGFRAWLFGHDLTERTRAAVAAWEKPARAAQRDPKDLARNLAEMKKWGYAQMLEFSNTSEYYRGFLVGLCNAEKWAGIVPEEEANREIYRLNP